MIMLCGSSFFAKFIRRQRTVPCLFCLFLLFSAEDINDDIRAGVDIDASGIEADGVVVGIAHLTSGVLLVVGLAEFIALFDVLFDTGGAVLGEFHGALCTALYIGVKIDAEGIYACLAKNIICTAPDDDAGGLGKLQDDFLLSFENRVVGAAVGNCAVQDGVENFAGGLEFLAVPFDFFNFITALFGSLVYEISVIIRDSEPFRQFVGQGSSESTVFSADRNDRAFFHGDDSCFFFGHFKLHSGALQTTGRRETAKAVVCLP